MLPLLDQLPAQARVLDLGAAAGSFPRVNEALCVVRLDLETPHTRGAGSYVIGDAARMPFAARSFDLIVANHSLEHFVELEAALREAGRVIKRDGAMYVAVPDATTLTDRIYRWMGRGGGHVNPFRSAAEVIGLIERLTGLKYRSTCVLFSSLSFLNAHNFVARPPRKIALFAFGNERFLAVLTWFLRLVDRGLGTGLSRYGWSFYFGEVDSPPSGDAWVNVCVRCGSGHPEGFLRKSGAARKALGVFKTYRCPACGGFNLLTRERRSPAALRR